MYDEHPNAGRQTTQELVGIHNDSASKTTGKTAEETIEKMEEDAQLVLKFMASNGLVANAKKTSFLLLNYYKQKDSDLSIKIGNDIVPRDSTAKLLGIQFEDSQQWRTQVFGKGGLLSALNSRLYFIRRLKSHLAFKSILKLVDGLFTSKLRYGVQLLGKVRTSTEDTVCAEFKSIQLVQNNLLRTLNGSKIKDMVSISSMIEKFNMLSVNQLNASVKLLEIWKALKVDNYPLSINTQETRVDGSSTRADTAGRPKEIGKSILTQKTCVSDAIHTWNKAPKKVTDCETLYQAKKAIRTFAKSLPI